MAETIYGPGQWPKEWERVYEHGGIEYTVICAPFYTGTSPQQILAVKSSKPVEPCGQIGTLLVFQLLLYPNINKDYKTIAVESLEKELGLQRNHYEIVEENIKDGRVEWIVKMTAPFPKSLLKYQYEEDRTQS